MFYFKLSPKNVVFFLTFLLLFKMIFKIGSYIAFKIPIASDNYNKVVRIDFLFYFFYFNEYNFWDVTWEII